MAIGPYDQGQRTIGMSCCDLSFHLGIKTENEEWKSNSTFSTFCPKCFHLGIESKSRREKAVLNGTSGI